MNVDIMAATEFERWCDEIDLSTVTRQLLKSEGFTTLERVRVLGETDLEVLNLDQNQKQILIDALSALNTRASQTSKQSTPMVARAVANEPHPATDHSNRHSADDTNREESRLYPKLDGLENEFSDNEVEVPITVSKPQEDSQIYPIELSGQEKTESKSKPIDIAIVKTGASNDDEIVSPTPNSKGGFLKKNFFGKNQGTPKEPKKEKEKEKEKEDKSSTKKKVKLPMFKKGNKTKTTATEITAETIEAPETNADLNESNELDTSQVIEVTEHPLSVIESPVVRSLKEKFLGHSNKVRDGCPAVYQLPQITVSRSEETYVRHCEIAIPDFPVEMVLDEKVLLCVGASGAGKTTLINGLANYLLDVQWDDPYRFQIIPDKEDKNDMDSASQTRYITAYTFYIEKPGSFAPSKVTIIDTPGFGDTKGIECDQELDTKIRNLFDQKRYGLDMLHGVCFTTQASDCKLNAFQRYVYHRVLSIFGKDVEKNIFMMVTFADPQVPPVVKVLQENQIPFQRYFKFNNSALFVNNRNDEGDEQMKFNQMFWDMGMNSFESFINFLDNSVEPVPLSLTKEVMAKREVLQVYVAGLQDNVKKGLVTLDQMRQEMNVVRQHEADIARNCDFTYQVREYFTQKIDKPEGQHVTNCQNCNRTCHLNCKYANDSQKKKCSAMDSHGDCKICTPSKGGKCPWTCHFNMAYYFVFKHRVVEKRSDELFHKYKRAAGLKVDAETLLAQIGDKFSNIQGEVLWQTNEIRKCLSQLGEIALKPNPLTTVDYIDQMIMAEKDVCQPGWRERVYQLEIARQRAMYLQKLADEGYDPWEEHSRIDIGDESKESRLNSVSEFLHKLKTGVWSLVADDDSNAAAADE